MFGDEPDQFENLLDDVSELRSGLPVLDMQVMGNKTLLHNFTSIKKSLKRPEKHLTRFLSRNLGARMKVTDGQLEINTKLAKNQLQRTLDRYIDTYIVCPECGKTDTKITGKKLNKLECLACGSISTIAE